MSRAAACRFAGYGICRTKPMVLITKARGGAREAIEPVRLGARVARRAMSFDCRWDGEKASRAISPSAAFRSRSVTTRVRGFYREWVETDRDVESSDILGDRVGRLRDAPRYIARRCERWRSQAPVPAACGPPPVAPGRQPGQGPGCFSESPWYARLRYGAGSEGSRRRAGLHRRRTSGRRR
jgi:hypothetical protein